MEDAGAPFLRGLQRLPAMLHRTRGPGRRSVAEDMRMAADELVVSVPCDRLEVTAAALREQEREEERLIQQVAELVDELRVVVGHGSVRNLVGLLDRVRHDRSRRLLGIPRALAAQQGCELLQLGERLLEAQPVEVVVAGVVSVAGGARPEAYVILSSYSFFSSSSHFVTASDFFWPSQRVRDRLAYRLQRRRLAGVLRRERLDDVPAELRLDGLGDLPDAERERDLLERRAPSGHAGR